MLFQTNYFFTCTKVKGQENIIKLQKHIKVIVHMTSAQYSKNTGVCTVCVGGWKVKVLGERILVIFRYIFHSKYQEHVKVSLFEFQIAWSFKTWPDRVIYAGQNLRINKQEKNRGYITDVNGFINTGSFSQTNTKNNEVAAVVLQRLFWPH